MPAGLDGNPDPTTSPARAAVLSELADVIVGRRTGPVLRVAVDGVDGAGKSTFADELAAVLHSRGCAVIRSTTDSFHHPRAVRWARGKLSPEGFYRDSHDIPSLKALLLDPLSARPPQPYAPAAFDEPSDSQLDVDRRIPEPGAVLVFDGLFLQRAELRHYWDHVIYLDGEARVRDGRVRRVSEACPPGLWGSVELFRWCALLDRYVGGFRLYVDECDPRGNADVVVDNNDFLEPRVLRTQGHGPMTDRPRPSAIPDVYVLVRRASSILLLHRAGTGYKDGQWGPPAGKVEAGETYVEAAQRELFEEVGLSVPAADLRFVHVIDRMPSGGGSRWIGLFFEVDCGGREPFNAEPGKHAALAFFDRSELPANTVDYVRHAIEAIEQGQSFSHWEYSETEDG